MAINQSTIEKFWGLVDIGEPDECWPFIGHRARTGYGSTWVVDRAWLAHRFAHFLTTGEEPTVVMHECDNKACCNPAHLRSGTYKQNTRDALERGLMSVKLRKIGGLCGNGHLLVGANVDDRRGKIECVECKRVAKRAYKARVRAARDRQREQTALDVPVVEIGDIVVTERGRVQRVDEIVPAEHYRGAKLRYIEELGGGSVLDVAVIAIYRDPLWRRPQAMPTKEQP